MYKNIISANTGDILTSYKSHIVAKTHPIISKYNLPAFILYVLLLCVTVRIIVRLLPYVSNYTKKVQILKSFHHVWTNEYDFS